MKVASIEGLSENKTEFKIYTGTQNFWLRVKDVNKKKKWLNALRLAQEESSSEDQKIKAIKALLSGKNFIGNVDKELQILLNDEQTNLLADKVAVFWDKEARLKEQLSNFSDIANNLQKKYIGGIVKLGEALKKNLYSCLNIIEDEKKKLIVIYEVFRNTMKNTSSQFKDRSFQLTLEKLLEDKSNLNIKQKSIIIEESDNDSFHSLEANPEEFKLVEESFFRGHTAERLVKERNEIKGVSFGER